MTETADQSILATRRFRATDEDEEAAALIAPPPGEHPISQESRLLDDDADMLIAVLAEVFELPLEPLDSDDFPGKLDMAGRLTFTRSKLRLCIDAIKDRAEAPQDEVVYDETPEMSMGGVINEE